MHTPTYPPARLDMSNFHLEEEAVDWYFSFYTLEETHERLRELFRGFLVTDMSHLFSIKQNHHYLRFYQHLCILVEASFLLRQKYEQDDKRKNEIGLEAWLLEQLKVCCPILYDQLTPNH